MDILIVPFLIENLLTGYPRNASDIEVIPDPDICLPSLLILTFACWYEGILRDYCLDLRNFSEVFGLTGYSGYASSLIYKSKLVCVGISWIPYYYAAGLPDVVYLVKSLKPECVLYAVLLFIFSSIFPFASVAYYIGFTLSTCPLILRELSDLFFSILCCFDFKILFVVVLALPSAPSSTPLCLFSTS